VYKGKELGTFGDVGCFSFFTNKNLSVGEGGMFVTNSPELDRTGKLLRSHGMTTLTLDRYEGRAISYDVTRPGLNYRIDEMRAALGLVQLEKLKAANAKRGELVRRYTEGLHDVGAVQIPFRHLMKGENAFHIFPVLLGESVDRLQVIDRLKKAGIQTSIHYPCFASFTAHREYNAAQTPIAAAIAERVLTLPLHPNLRLSDVDYVVEHVREAVNE
jgi:dTDP-4-amino-4,6-dideoxygalactose transaminase